MVKPQDRRQWYQIKNLADVDNEAPEILIYGEIDSFFGVSAADFVRDMAQIDAPAITVRINSPGGDVFDAVAILNAMRGHDAKITTIIDGIAASSASLIAMGGDEIVMNENSQFMVHNAWAVKIGDADDMAKAADMLGRQNANIASIYAAKAGGTVEDWLAVMDAETWMTADETVQAGLADRVAKADADSSSSIFAKLSTFDLSNFRYPGREAAPAPLIAARAQAPQPVEAEDTQGKEPIVASLNESLVETLGLDAEADDDAIAAAVAALKEKAETPPPEPEPAPEPTIAELGKVAAKHNAVVMDKSVVDQLTAEARLGAEARAQQISEDQDRTISDALKTGRITPKSSAEWRKSLEENPVQTKALLATIPANSAVPMHEIGYGRGEDVNTAEVDQELERAHDRVMASLGYTTRKAN